MLRMCVAACGALTAWLSAQNIAPQVHLRLEAQHIQGSRLTGRKEASRNAAAAAVVSPQRQHALIKTAQAMDAASSLNASWQSVGPNQIASASYGQVTGRVTAIAIDPSDNTGNTVYLGTTGGGVWKSTNAAGPSGAVHFAPLTDNLPVYNPNAGTAVIPSLSIGAISVQPGAANNIVLAGTGDPNDSPDSYYGAGLLRSTDGGATWSLIQYANDFITGVPINHSFVGLSVAGFAWSNTTTSLVVAAISDSLRGDLANASDPNYSVRGLYYSIDAGVTWKMSTVMDGTQTVQKPQQAGANVGGNSATAVVWNPVRKLFYAAIRYHGYYQSPDGITWTRIATQPATSLSLTACPTNPGTTGNPTCPIFRGALAVQPVTGDTFALTTDSGNIDQGLWQDACSAAGSACSTVPGFGTQLSSMPLEEGGGSAKIPQADYNLALAAVASGVVTGSPDTLLFVGTTDLYRCSLGAGCTLRNTTNARNGCAAPAGVAGAQHAIASLGTTQTPLYLGNDGGLWRSTDGVDQQAMPCSTDDATHFQNLNSGLGSLAEIISFAQDPVDPNKLLGGFGANGSAGTSAAGSAGLWGQLAAGEGGTVAIDPVNPQNWYLSTAAGVSIRHCGNGSACSAADFGGPPTIGLPQVSNDASLLDPPWLLDPARSSNLIIGTCRVWRGPAANGAAWNPGNAISTLLAGSPNSACTTNPVLRSLAAGGPASGSSAAQDSGSTILYAGMAGQFEGGGTAGGHVFSTQAGATAGNTTVWTDLTNSPVTNGVSQFNADGFGISSLAADVHDATGRTIYATVMGFASVSGHLYRSIDAGAHWTNISSNLPNVPANSVLVDPNDANTLYIALDTGIYVTTAVTTCTTANCWSIYGVGLPNAPVVQLAAAGAMATGDGRFGELRAATYGRGIWQIPLLTASIAAQAAISLSPASLIFSAQAVGTASAAQTITVTNTGTAPLNVSSVTISGGLGLPITPSAQDFGETDTCTTSPVAPSASCAVQVVFQPLAAGTRPGLLTVFGNVPGGQATASLSGTATPPASIVLTPITLSFPATAVGATAPAENITISNTGGTPATLGTPIVTGDFRLSVNTCGTTLAASTGCTVAIVFAPTVSGVRSGTLTLTDSAGTQTASLRGSGILPATDALSPATLTFAPQQANTVSPTQQVMLTNSGDVALTLITATTSGDFIAVNACGNSLNAHSTCSIAVSYVPKNVGSETGALTIADQFRSQAVSLAGFGLAPPGVSLAPFSAVTFAPLGVGIVSVGQTVTLTNNGGVPLAISGFAVGGDFAILSGSNTCGSSLAVSTACTLQVAFAPTAAAARVGSLTVTDSAASSPQTLVLGGTGVDFTLAAGNSTASVTSGHSAVYPLLLSSVAGVPGSAVFSCSGAPANSTCMVVPGTIALGSGTALATVTIATGVATASVPAHHRTLWFALLLPLGLGALGARRRTRFGAGLMILCGLLTVVSCSSPRTIPGSDNPTAPTAPTPTPSGTSTIVVSASSAGLVRTVNLSLTVQ